VLREVHTESTRWLLPAMALGIGIRTRIAPLRK
jgi:hypothetical protein